MLKAGSTLLRTVRRHALPALAVAAFCAVGIPWMLHRMSGGRFGGERFIHNRLDMRRMESALHRYWSDRGEFPPAAPLPAWQARGLDGWGLAAALTTPVAYLDSLPLDRVPGAARDSGDAPFLLYYAKGDEYLLLSRGEDGAYQISDPRPLLGGGDGTPLAERLEPFTFDPSRGWFTNRGGDQWVHRRASAASPPR